MFFSCIFPLNFYWSLLWTKIESGLTFVALKSSSLTRQGATKELVFPIAPARPCAARVS